MYNIREYVKKELLNTALKVGQGYGRNKNPIRWIFDIREISLKTKCRKYMGILLWNRIKKYEPTVIMGLDFAGTPLALSIIDAAIDDNYEDMKICIFHKNRKEYGTRKIYSGYLPMLHDRVVIVDDILNSGYSCELAYNYIDQINSNIVGCCFLINFLRDGHEKFKNSNINFEYEYDLNELGMKFNPVLLKLNIKLIWKIMINNPIDDTIQPKVMIIDNNIYLPTDRSTFCIIDKNKGTVLKEYDLDFHLRGARSCPVFHDKDIYFGSYSGHLYRYSIQTKEMKSKKIIHQIHGSSIITDKSIIIPTEYYRKNGDFVGSMLSLEKDSWDVNWEFKTEGPIPCNPLAYKNTIIVGSNDGCVYNVYIVNGLSKWIYKTGGPVKNIIISQKFVFASSFDGYLYCLDINTGSKIWCKRLGRQIRFTPTILEDGIIIGTDSHKVFKVDFEGNILWITSLDDVIVGGSALYKNIVFIGCNSGSIYAISVENGEKLWSYKTDRCIKTFPIIDENRLYFTSHDGFLYLFEIIE